MAAAAPRCLSTVPKPGGKADPTGVAVSPHIVNAPAYTNGAGEQMRAVGADGTDLYGAFGHMSGADLHWGTSTPINAANAGITCVNS